MIRSDYYGWIKREIDMNLVLSFMMIRSFICLDVENHLTTNQEKQDELIKKKTKTTKMDGQTY